MRSGLWDKHYDRFACAKVNRSVVGVTYLKRRYEITTRNDERGVFTRAKNQIDVLLIRDKAQNPFLIRRKSFVPFQCYNLIHYDILHQ